jgi:hypothetical protein
VAHDWMKQDGPKHQEGQSPATPTKKDPQASDDLAFGQYVVVTARWILVAAGLVLSLWVTSDATSTKTLQQVQISFVVLTLLAFGNFYLNLQLLRKRPALDVVAYGASAADLVVITVLIAAQGGFTSNVYIFYFPALLAISVAFTRTATAVYTAFAILAYASTVSVGITNTFDWQTLVTRLAMFAAVAFCGNMYFTIEHDRRRDAARAREQMTAALGQR